MRNLRHIVKHVQKMNTHRCLQCLLRHQLNTQQTRSLSLHHLNFNQKISSFDDLVNKDDTSRQKDPDDGNEERKTPLMKRIMIASVITAAIAGTIAWVDYTKEEEKLVKREVQLSKVDIGAQDYSLVDHTGKNVSKKDFLGKWLLLYFGFCHCPDICPEELEKMSEIIEIINSDGSVPQLQPIFLSVDPDRDTPAAITEYLNDFHPTFIGLTGTNEQVKNAAQTFRVYYNAGPKDADNDYIIDHTIVMYLMNPKGNFVDYYGSRSVATQDIVDGITKNMKNYKRLHG